MSNRWLSWSELQAHPSFAKFRAGTDLLHPESWSERPLASALFVASVLGSTCEAEEPVGPQDQDFAGFANQSAGVFLVSDPEYSGKSPVFFTVDLTDMGSSVTVRYEDQSYEVPFETMSGDPEISGPLADLLQRSYWRVLNPEFPAS